MAIPGRIAALLVASILIHGYIFRSTWKSLEKSLEKGVKHGAKQVKKATKSSSNTISPVQVQVYMESLCIDSKKFTLNQLKPAFELLGTSIMNLEVIIYGNAQLEIDPPSLTCQHGPAECDANSYEQCAIDAFRYPARYLPFLECLFSTLPMGHRNESFDSSVFASCAQHSALDWTAIAQCHSDQDYAWNLQRQAAHQTPRDHTYVPWVVVNGKHSMNEDHDDLIQVICKAYIEKGGSHSACSR